MLQDGVLNVEAFLMIKACQPFGIGEEHLWSFLKDKKWQLPAATATKDKALFRIFDAYRRDAANEVQRLKCSASELLGVYGLIRHLIEVFVGRRDAIAPQRHAFDQACSAVDLILHAKYGAATCSSISTNSRACLSRHLELHIASYGTGRVRPKHHWALDLASQVERDHLILDAFVVERMHLEVKSVAEHVCNTVRFERSVLAGVLNKRWRSVTDDANIAGLRGPTCSWPGQQHVFVADALEMDAKKICSGDLVACDAERAVGQVTACIADVVARSVFVVVDVLAFVAPLSEHSSTWGLSDLRDVWSVSDVTLPLAWYVGANGTIVVVHK